MAAYMNIFVKTEKRIRDFALEFGRLLGKPLTHKQMEVGDVYETDTLGTRVVVFGHSGLADDGDDNLNFTRYQIQIDIGPTTGGPEHDALVQAMAAFLASEISHKLKCPTMLTEGLRKLIRTFDVDR